MKAAVISFMCLGALTVTTHLSATPADFSSESAVPEASILGALDYQGGFVHRQRIQLSAPVWVSSFRVSVPAFCSGVEILEAGTVTEGIEDQAVQSPARQGIFTVNGGNGARVSAIFLTLNGPVTAACAIPVFNGEQLPPDDSDACEVEVSGTNSYASASYPARTGWNEATTRRFIDGALWSQPLVVEVAQSSAGFTVIQAPGTCNTYAYIKYNPAACGSDFVAPGAATLVGEIKSAGQTERLFGFLTARNTWNACVRFTDGIIFRRSN